MSPTKPKSLFVGGDRIYRVHLYPSKTDTTKLLPVNIVPLPRSKNKLEEKFQNYKHYNIDIRNNEELEKVFKLYNEDIKLIVHTAAQPSHDWAAKEPFTDFTVNAINKFKAKA